MRGNLRSNAVEHAEVERESDFSYGAYWLLTLIVSEYQVSSNFRTRFR